MVARTGNRTLFQATHGPLPLSQRGKKRQNVRSVFKGSSAGTLGHPLRVPGDTTFVKSQLAPGGGNARNRGLRGLHSSEPNQE